jgi:Na+-driven multidrug efflux pump
LMATDNYNPITGEVIPVFVRYAIPSVIGMLAATSAGLIDGIFIGNFVGAAALASVNISMPAFALFAAVVFMLAVGGSVMAGKFIGEGDADGASSIFSKIIYTTALVALLITVFSLLFLDEVVTALGANDDLRPMVTTYLRINLYAAPLLILGLTLDWFVRIDGRPILASAALVAFAVVNIILDVLFIVIWDWGIAGAAWATAIAEASVLFMLLGHWIGDRSTLKLLAFAQCWKEGWHDVLRAAYNGFSEFANELSIGLITLLFNWVMITRLGVTGVAAFTIVSYLLMVGLEVCYGISDSLQPTVSKNLGARQPERIVQFLTIAMATSFSIGVIICAVLIFVPEALIALFLGDGEQATEAIALSFIAVFWPAFLFNGLNLNLAAYFTALHRPMQSAALALSRSLVLPGLGILLLPIWWGDTGIFVAIPIAEAVTFLFGLALLFYNKPTRIIQDTYDKELTP